jgi:hypothetical protein
MRREARAEGRVLAWETTAKGYNPAMRPLHDHLGYGDYKPLLTSRRNAVPGVEDDDA